MGGLPSSTGQLPSAADGSRIDAIPNGRIASAANTNGRACRWGGPPSTYAVWSRCRISGPSAPVRPAVRLWSAWCGPYQSAPGMPANLRALGNCVAGFRALAPWDRGENISGRTCVFPLQARLRVRAFGTCAPRWPRGWAPGVPGRAYQGTPSPPASLP